VYSGRSSQDHPSANAIHFQRPDGDEDYRLFEYLDDRGCHQLSGGDNTSRSIAEAGLVEGSDDEEICGAPG